jgi:CheY-like chemotaxis protein
MGDTWNILVVDDEQDMHTITRMALRKYRWRDKKFALTSAHSASEARDLLSTPDGDPFHVALVDVVMEDEKAGLDLCDYIRERCPRSLRIVLRTGQAGAAPMLEVLEQYDVDFYLSKTEAVPERLFAVLRACLRSSEDIRALGGDS